MRRLAILSTVAVTTGVALFLVGCGGGDSNSGGDASNGGAAATAAPDAAANNGGAAANNGGTPNGGTPNGGTPNGGTAGGAAGGAAVSVPGQASGTAGGPRDASEVYGNGCVGWIPATANHTITFASPTVAAIAADTPGGEDTAMVVVGPNNTTMCNDDRKPGDNTNPLVSGMFAAGTYQVFVGTYSSGGSAAYNLRTIGGGNFTESPQYGPLSAPGQGKSSGLAGGPRDAGTIPGDCRGYIDTSADHTLTVASATNVVLDVQVADANADTTLVIIGPDGQGYCGDDRSSDDRSPFVAANLQPGSYEVYIGTYSSGDPNYEYQIYSMSY